MTDNYISIDLNDSRSKDIAEIIGNSTCKKILNLIAERELTETEISQELKLPLNTIDYNIKKLVKAGLIESENHWWSTKGKKMPSYKISNKKIIISPKSFSSKLAILPVLAVGGILAWIIKRASDVPPALSTEITAKSSSVAQVAFSVASSGVEDSARNSVEPVATTATHSLSWFMSLSSWEWFLIGAWFSTVLFFLVNYILERGFKK